MARDRVRDEDVDTSLADRFGIPRTFKKAEAGPHAIVTAGHNPFPGLKYTVLRDGKTLGCVLKIDSKRRTATCFGMPLAWVWHMEMLGYDFDLSDEEVQRIDLKTRCAGDKETVGVLPIEGHVDVQIPKSRVLDLNGVEAEFAGMEYEMPYDTIMVELDDAHQKAGNPGPWLDHKGKLPQHWYCRI